MRHPYVYTGCFIAATEFHEILKRVPDRRLERTINYPHVTFTYKPEVVDETLFGEKVRIRVIGYGNNGENEGVKVELSAENPVLETMGKEIEVPHITVSVSREGKAVNTKFLEFEKIEPFEIDGRFGGFAQWREVITQINISSDE